MATFTLNWDNTLVLASANTTGQRVSYRQKDIGNPWITAGFTPPNDLTTADITADVDLTTNLIWEFKVEALCNTGGPTANDNGIIEQIVFECVEPDVLTSTETEVTVSIDLTATNITQVRFRLRKQGDNSLVQTIITVCPGGLGTTSATFIGLVENTAYYVTAELYCVINGVTVISSDVDYLNDVCGGNFAPWQITTVAAAIPNLVFSWNRTAGDAINLTPNINGTFTTIDWGDGTINSILTHTYVGAGTQNYTIKMYDSTASSFILSDGIDIITYNVTAVTKIPDTITHLDISKNIITVLVDLSGASSLLYLNYSQNLLTAFPNISNNLLLQELYLNNNNIAGTYDFTLNTALNTIIINNNSITGITGFTSTVLLGDLEFEQNGISVTDVNNALIALDTNGITFGNFISTAQTPLAAPTGLGAAAVINLIGKGWTVITD